MNNKSIQILRTKLNNTDTKIANEVLLDGQPFYNKTSNKLYVGDGTKKISELKYVGQEVDESLQSQISAEITNRANADDNLQSQISAEIQRSTAFDSSHNNIENGTGEGSLNQKGYYRDGAKVYLSQTLFN